MNGQSNGQGHGQFATVEEYIAANRDTVDPKAMLDVLLAQTSRIREENQLAIAETRELAEVDLTESWDFKPKNLAGLWRLGKMFSQSGMVPDHYKNKPADCAIAAQMALRCGVPIMMFLQSSYVVHGTPGIRATLAIAMLNKSGLIDGRVHFEMEYDAAKKPICCTSYVKDKQSGERIDMRIDWGVVTGEGWNRDKEKNGVTYKSKWNTMPELMFKYRAAAWLIRQNYPDVILGMQTTEELEDTEAQLKLANAESRAASLQAEMAGLEQRLAGPSDQVVSPNDAATPIGEKLAKAKAEREAKKAAPAASDGGDEKKVAEGKALDAAKEKQAGKAGQSAKASEAQKAPAASQPENQPAKAAETAPAAPAAGTAQKPATPAAPAQRATPSRQKAAAAPASQPPAAGQAAKPATASPAAGPPAAKSAAEKALPGMEPEPAGEVLAEIPLGSGDTAGNQDQEQAEADDYDPGSTAPAAFDIGDWQARIAGATSVDALEEIRNDAAMNLQPDDYQDVLTVVNNRVAQIRSPAKQNRF